MRPQRPSADSTRKLILEAAKASFLKTGFHGTSTPAIAKKANIHQNLLFHHFKNKKTLWRQVKKHIVENSHIQFKLEVSNLKNFVTSLVCYCFELYQKHPELIQLLQWQQVEQDTDDLFGMTSVSPRNWASSIKYLQKRGLIKPGLDSEVVLSFLTTNIMGFFLQNYIVLNNEQKKKYQELVIQSCLQTLENK